MADRTRLLTKIRHDFTDKSLLNSALSHPSTAGEQSRNYERMEFLGDRVLGLVVSHWLYEKYGEDAEGTLNRRFTGLVNRWALADIARSLGVDEAVHLGDDENGDQLRQQPALLANTLEAIIAALYLDGGLEPARSFIHEHWERLLTEDLKPPKDPKTALQEWAQGRGLGLPEYTVVERSGPSHAPFFRMTVSVAGGEPTEGSGPSNRAAQMQAASELLKRLENS